VKTIIVTTALLFLLGCHKDDNISKTVPIDNSKAIATADSGMPQGHGMDNATGDMNPQAMPMATGRKKVDEIQIKESEIPQVKDGIRIGEIFNKKSSLGGKSIVVSGKVVKFNANIMGKNWIHIQDGTKDGESYDLTITSNDNVAVGDIISAKGELAHEKDFGAGYKYDVIIEKASITKIK